MARGGGNLEQAQLVVLLRELRGGLERFGRLRHLCLRHQHVPQLQKERNKNKNNDKGSKFPRHKANALSEPTG